MLKALTDRKPCRSLFFRLVTGALCMVLYISFPGENINVSL